MGAFRTYAKPSQDTERTAIPVEPAAKAGDRSAGGHYDPAALLRLVAPGQSVSPALRTGAFHDAQQQYGNRAVQRMMAGMPVVQRKCACGGSCSSCKEEEERRRAGVQRQAAGPVANMDSTVQEIDRHRGGGQPLEPGTRASMESRFGQDFSAVRVHTDGRAEEWAQRLNAHAFTTGRDIFFARRQYAPHTTDGQKLLAHELAHVVQQRNGTFVGGMGVGASGDNFEREADAAAEAAIGSAPVRVVGSTAARLLQRQKCDHDDDKPPGCGIGVGRGIRFTWSEAQRQSTLRQMVEQRAPGATIVTNLTTYPNSRKQGASRGFIDVARVVIRDQPSAEAPNGLSVLVQVGELKSSNTNPSYTGEGPAGGCTLATYEVDGYVESYTSRAQAVIDASHGRGTSQGYTGLVNQINFLRRRPFTSFSAERLPLAGLWGYAEASAGGIEQRRYATVEANGAGGFSYRCYPTREALPQEERFVPFTGPVSDAAGLIQVFFSPRGFSLFLPPRARAGEKVTIAIPRESRGLLPGLEFQEAIFNLGPDRRPTSGQLVANATIPFARNRAQRFTFSVDATQHAHVELRVPVRVGTLGETELHVQSREGRLYARSTFTPAPRFLKNGRAEILYEDGQFSGGLTFTPESLRLPIPGLTVENARGGLTFSREGIAGEGGATLKYRGLGQADITARYDRKGLDVEGLLTVNIPGLQPVTGAISYRRGQLAAEVRLTKEHFPAGLPLERGSITMRLVDGQVEGSGHMGVRLGPVGRGDLTFAYQNGNVELGAGIQLKIPGLRGGIVTLRYREGQLEGEGQIPLNSDRLPGLGGNLRVWYREGRFGGETRFSYRSGELAGTVTVTLQQLEDGSLAISGGGDVSARITPWLVGTVHVDITPEAEVNVQGEIRAPKEVPLFRRKPLDKMKTFPRVEIPLFGFSIPVVGHVGLVAFIEGGGGFTAFVGPAVLRNITVAGAFSTQEEQSPAFDVSGEFYLAAGAEAFLFIRGGISLGALVAEIEGAITLQGGLEAVGSLSVIPHIGYANGDYYFRGNWQLQALAYLRLSGKAEAAIRVGVWRLKKTVWDDEWPLFNWVFPLGLNVGLKGRMEYTFGRPFEPSFEFQADELDPMSIAKAAVPGPKKSPSSGPGAPPAPRGEMQTEEVPGVRAATAEARPAVGAKPAAVAATATPRPPVRAAAAPRPIRPAVSVPVPRAIQAPAPVRAAIPAPVGGAPGARPSPMAPLAPPRRPSPAATAPVSPAAVNDQAPPVTESAPRIDIAFEEAGERHHIWVEFVNGRPRLMVASTPMNINDFLDYLQQVVIPGLPEPERPPLLERVRQLRVLALMIADPRARGSVPLNEQMNLMIPEIRALFRIIARRYQALGIPDPLGEEVRIMTLPMRNIAMARYEINGQAETLFTLSGETEIAGTAPQRGVFAARRIQTRFGGAGPRHHDNELEVLNYIANRFAQVTVADGVPEVSLRPRPEVRGRLYISSDFITCGSCAFAIGRFRRLFPNVILVATSQRLPTPPRPN